MLHLVNLVDLNFNFDLVLPFCFLKWDRYFSACENLQNSSCHFWKHKLVSLQLLHQSSVPSNITPLYFFSSNIINFGQGSPLKSEFFRFLSAPVKIPQIPHVNFEMTSQFLFKFCIILHCYGTWILRKFLAHAFSTLDKRIPSKSQFWHFQALWWTFAKFFMSFSKPQVRFSSNFASRLSVMKDNSSVLF